MVNPRCSGILDSICSHLPIRINVEISVITGYQDSIIRINTIEAQLIIKVLQDVITCWCIHIIQCAIEQTIAEISRFRWGPDDEISRKAVNAFLSMNEIWLVGHRLCFKIKDKRLPVFRYVTDSIYIQIGRNLEREWNTNRCPFCIADHRWLAQPYSPNIHPPNQYGHRSISVPCRDSLPHSS